MDIQRLRNLTTGKLHTRMEHVYEDLSWLTGHDCLYTHQLPTACDAVLPWLASKTFDDRLWDGMFDESHVGRVDLPEPTEEDKEVIRNRMDIL